MRADIHDGQEARNAPCNGPNTDAQDQLSPDRHIRLAPHGRSIQSTWSNDGPPSLKRCRNEIDANDGCECGERQIAEKVLLQLVERQLEEVETDIDAEQRIPQSVAAAVAEAQVGVPIRADYEGEGPGDK